MEMCVVGELKYGLSTYDTMINFNVEVTNSWHRKKQTIGDFTVFIGGCKINEKL